MGDMVKFVSWQNDKQVLEGYPEMTWVYESIFTWAGGKTFSAHIEITRCEQAPIQSH